MTGTDSRQDNFEFMDRRDFLKIGALSGAGATLTSCGNPEHQLIRLYPKKKAMEASPHGSQAFVRFAQQDVECWCG